MECDVIPDSPHEVDPLGNVENCNNLDADSGTYKGSLNATLIRSGDQVSIIPKNRKVLSIPAVGTKTNRKLLTVRPVVTAGSSQLLTLPLKQTSIGIVSQSSRNSCCKNFRSNDFFLFFILLAATTITISNQATIPGVYNAGSISINTWL